MTGTASLTISGSTFYLPGPELAYLRQQAEDSNTFVVLMKGAEVGTIGGRCTYNTAASKQYSKCGCNKYIGFSQWVLVKAFCTSETAGPPRVLHLLSDNPAITTTRFFTLGHCMLFCFTHCDQVKMCLLES